jgi:hypothetical protein
VPIPDDLEFRMLALDAVDEVVVQRRHVAILLRRQSFEPRLARMDGEYLHPGAGAEPDQRAQRLFRVLVVHADAAFDGDGNRNRCAHGRDAFGDKFRLAHQAGAEPAGLHAVRGTADIEIDFAVAEFGADPGGLGQLFRLRSAELQGYRIFAAIEPQQSLPIAAQDRIRCHHLGVEHRLARELAMEEPSMPVGQVHHGGDRK